MVAFSKSIALAAGFPVALHATQFETAAQKFRGQRTDGEDIGVAAGVAGGLAAATAAAVVLVSPPPSCPCISDNGLISKNQAYMQNGNYVEKKFKIDCTKS